MFPTRERFDTDDGTGREVLGRLVAQRDALVLDRAFELGRQCEPFRSVVVIHRVVYPIVGPLVLGGVHRDVGAAQQGVDVISVLRAQRDPDAGIDLHRHATDLVRLRNRRV
jgi:hypothetical protein